MNIVLPLEVSTDDLALAEAQARAYSTSLPDLVALRVRLMARDWRNRSGARQLLSGFAKDAERSKDSRERTSEG